MSRFSSFVVIAVCFSGCAPGVGALKSRSAEVRTLEQDLSAKKAGLKAVDRYERALKTGKGRWVAFGSKEILHAMTQYAPYRFKGSALSKKRLKGNLWFTRPSRVKFHPGNRMTYRTELGAKNMSVNLKGVFGASKSDERKIKEAIEGGGYADIEVRAEIDRKRGEVLLFGHCYQVGLNRHNTQDHRKYLKQGLNKKFFNRGKRLKLPKKVASSQPRLMSTPNHFIVIGRE